MKIKKVWSASSIHSGYSLNILDSLDINVCCSTKLNQLSRKFYEWYNHSGAPFKSFNSSHSTALPSNIVPVVRNECHSNRFRVIHNSVSLIWMGGLPHWALPINRTVSYCEYRPLGASRRLQVGFSRVDFKEYFENTTVVLLGSRIEVRMLSEV